MTPARFHVAPDVIVREGGSDRADWRRKGVCVTWTAWPWDPWYPGEGATSTDPVKRAAAWADGRALCASCPIRLLCLEDALDHESGSSYYRHGMRGGLDDTERANLARSRARRTKSEAAAINHGTDGGAQAHYRRGEKACPECLLGDARAHRRRKAEQRARKAGTT